MFLNQLKVKTSSTVIVLVDSAKLVVGMSRNGLCSAHVCLGRFLVCVTPSGVSFSFYKSTVTKQLLDFCVSVYCLCKSVSVGLGTNFLFKVILQS